MIIPNEDEILDVFNKVMIANGFGPFWDKEYTTAEKWDFIERIMAVAVSMVDVVKKFKEARNP